MELLKKKEEHGSLKKEERQELRRLEAQTRQDLSVFRSILKALGLPSETHQEILLRAYLDGFKQELMGQLLDEEKLQTDPKEFERLLSQKWQNFHTDKEALKLIRGIRKNFDDLHYRNLQAMSNPIGLNTLKSFPIIFTVFGLAIGSSIYRQVVTDPLQHGMDKNPGQLLENMSHLLHPTGIVSFYIFVAVSQQVSYRMYGLGRLMDGKVLSSPWGKMRFNGFIGRALAPSAGLAMGYFVSTLFDQMLQDPDVGKCAAQQFVSSTESPPHIDPCERAYLNWFGSGKGWTYLVDGGLLVGSALLSHRLIRYSVALARSTALGGAIYLKALRFLGLRLSGWVGFFANMFVFLEVHKILDEAIGQSLKESFSAGRAQSLLEEFNRYLETGLADIYMANNLDNASSLSEKTAALADSVKAIGHQFMQWANSKGVYYVQSYHLWMKKINKFLLPYEKSSDLLRDIYILSHFKPGLPIESNRAFEWDSYGDINNTMGSWKDWDSLNITMEFDGTLFLHPDRMDSFKTQYCSSAVFENWGAFCSNDPHFSVYPANNATLFFETAALIYGYLPEEAKDADYDFMPYLGESLGEMFSSHPDSSTQKLSLEEKILLATILIEKALYHPEGGAFIHNAFQQKKTLCAHYYPSHATDSVEQDLYNFCVKPEQYTTEIENFCFAQSAYLEESVQEITEGEAGHDNTDGLSQGIAEEEATLSPSAEEMYNLCLSSFASTEEQLHGIARVRALSAGIYLLKDLLRKRVTPFQGKYHSLEFIRPLADLLQVYKKGEALFVLESAEWKPEPSAPSEWVSDFLYSAEDFVDLFNRKPSLKPHLLLKNMLCGLSSDSDLSIIPRFVDPDVFVYDFSAGKFVKIEEACINFQEITEFSEGEQKAFHHLLFDRPATARGNNYENLYSALEGILEMDYPSSKDLAQAFYDRSQSRLNPVRDSLGSDMELLINNYYKDMINLESDITAHSRAGDLMAYYGSRGMSDISFSQGEDKKGLEISIFQVNYWLETLKKILVFGEGNGLNSEMEAWSGFDLKTFEEMQIEVLSLLQSYHDTYRKPQGPYLFIPEKDQAERINEVWMTEGRDGLEELYGKDRFAILKEMGLSAGLPVKMSKSVILSHIFSVSVPAWDNMFFQANLDNNIKVFSEEGTPWEHLLYSVFYELNQSLSGLLFRLDALSIKESLEHSIQSL